MKADNDPLARFTPLELEELIGYADAAHCPHCSERGLQARLSAQRDARAERRRAIVQRTLATTADTRQFLAAWLAARSSGSRREPASW